MASDFEDEIRKRMEALAAGKGGPPPLQKEADPRCEILGALASLRHDLAHAHGILSMEELGWPPVTPPALNDAARLSKNLGAEGWPSQVILAGDGIFSLFFPTAYSEKISQLLPQLWAAKTEIYVSSAFESALVERLAAGVKNAVLGLGEAQALRSQLEQLALKTADTSLMISQLALIAAQRVDGITALHAQELALAESMQIPLITAHPGLANLCISTKIGPFAL